MSLIKPELFIAVFVAILVWRSAKRRGMNPEGWAFLCLFLPFLAIAFLLVRKPKLPLPLQDTIREDTVEKGHPSLSLFSRFQFKALLLSVGIQLFIACVVWLPEVCSLSRCTASDVAPLGIAFLMAVILFPIGAYGAFLLRRRRNYALLLLLSWLCLPVFVTYFVYRVSQHLREGCSADFNEKCEEQMREQQVNWYQVNKLTGT